MSDSCAVDPRPTVTEKAPEGLVKSHNLHGPSATRPPEAGGEQADWAGQVPVAEYKESEE